MKRQGLITTIKELRELIEELEDDFPDEETGVKE